MNRYFRIAGLLACLMVPLEGLRAQSTLRSEAARVGFYVGNAAWKAGTRGHESGYTNTLKREFNGMIQGLKERGGAANQQTLR